MIKLLIQCLNFKPSSAERPLNSGQKSESQMPNTQLKTVESLLKYRCLVIIPEKLFTKGVKLSNNIFRKMTRGCIQL